MISLQITQSPDIMVCDEFIFYKNLITIGSKNCNINIDDNQIRQHHLSIEVISDGKLVVHPATKVQSFLVNGKLTSQKCYITNNQKIKIGSTILQLINFQYENIDDIKAIRDKNLIKLSKEENAKWKLLDNIKLNLE